MAKSDSGVMNIKKKVANLKQELDEANDRANNAEAALRDKEVAIDKVSGFTRYVLYLGSSFSFRFNFYLSCSTSPIASACNCTL